MMVISYCSTGLFACNIEETRPVKLFNDMFFACFSKCSEQYPEDYQLQSVALPQIQRTDGRTVWHRNGNDILVLFVFDVDR